MMGVRSNLTTRCLSSPFSSSSDITGCNTPFISLHSYSHQERSDASSRHYFLPEAIPTASTTHDKLLLSCAVIMFSFDAVRCPCSHSDSTPFKSVLWWINGLTNITWLKTLATAQQHICRQLTLILKMLSKHQDIRMSTNQVQFKV